MSKILFSAKVPPDATPNDTKRILAQVRQMKAQLEEWIADDKAGVFCIVLTEGTRLDVYKSGDELKLESVKVVYE